MNTTMSRTTVFCGVCGYSAPRLKDDRVGKHYIYNSDIKFLCLGSGHFETETHYFPLRGSRSRVKVGENAPVDNIPFTRTKI